MTSIFWILRRNFRKRWAALEGDHFNDRAGNDVLHSICKTGVAVNILQVLELSSWQSARGNLAR